MRLNRKLLTAISLGASLAALPALAQSNGPSGSEGAGNEGTPRQVPVNADKRNTADTGDQSNMGGGDQSQMGKGDQNNLGTDDQNNPGTGEQGNIDTGEPGVVGSGLPVGTWDSEGQDPGTSSGETR